MESKKPELNMNRVRFGALVAGLREDLPLTQLQLAEETGMPLRIIQDVEQGRRVDLHKDNVLLKLATALQLTTLERQQFLFAASGVLDAEDFLRTNSDLTPTGFDPKAIIAEIQKIMMGLRVPAIVTDSYCDILMVNQLMIQFLQIPTELIATSIDPNIVDGRNMLRFLFHEKATYSDLIGDDWEKHALLNIRFFRRMSLRYRGTQYFSELKRGLDKHEKFRKYWKRTIAEVNDEFLSYAPYKLKILGSPDIEYVGAEMLLAVTPYGELYMHIYIPLDDYTAKIFDDLYSAIGPSCENFAPFPDERKSKIRRSGAI